MDNRRALIYSVIAVLLAYPVIGGLMFLLAGTAQLPFFWVVLGSQMLISLVSLAFIDPDLISERFKPRGEDLDKKGLPLVVLLFVLVLLIPPLDVGRFHWSDTVPSWLQWVAVAVQALCWLGFAWTMHTNRYFSSAIRLQEDRGQQVITTGPYHWIRHPGYAFGLIGFSAQAIALGSWLTLAFSAVLAVVLAKRTLLEEKMLFESLPGYAEYAEIVRYRWFSGIW